MLAGLIIVLMVIGLTLQIVTSAPFAGVPFLIHISEIAGLSGFAVIGALIASRHPRHPIGWIWLLISFSFGVDHFAWGYAYYGYIAHPGSLPGTEIMIVWQYWHGRGTLGILGITLLLLLFPTGRPLSRRWRAIIWIAVGCVVLSFPVTALSPDPIGYFPFPTDLVPARDAVRAFLEPFRIVIILVAFLCVIMAASSLILRLKQTRSVERQQLKWFVYTMSFLPPAFLLIFLGGFQQTSSINFFLLLGAMLGVTTSLGMAFASVIAIFRYRLYDIDIVIHRTLTYSILTATLTILYFSCVLLLSQIFGAITGQKNSRSPM